MKVKDLKKAIEELDENADIEVLSSSNAISETVPVESIDVRYFKDPVVPTVVMVYEE